MKPSSDLHDLILALTPTEKRYFRVSAGRMGEGENNYIRLFDAIAAQPQYDEEALKTQFAGEAFVKHLPSEKNYLYNSILRAMRAFHEGNDIDSRLMALLAEIDFLFERQLYEQCRKAVAKASKLAEEYERVPLLLILYDWASRLEKLLTAKGLADAMDGIATQRNNALRQIQRSAAVAIDYDRFFAFATTIYLPGDSSSLDTDPRFNALPDEVPGDSFESRLRLHTARAIRSHLQGDFASATHHYEAAGALWDAHPAFREDDPTNYLRCLANILAGYHNLSSYDRFPEVIARIRGLRKGTFAVDLGQFVHGDYYELLYHIATGKFQEGLRLAEQIPAGLARFARQIAPSRELAFRYNLGILYFFSDKRKQALDAFRSITDMPDSGIRTDLRHAARILLLVIHFDLGNWDFLEMQCRNTKRVLQRRNEAFPFEQIMIDFIESACRNTAPKHLDNCIDKLHGALEDLAKSNGEGSRSGLDEVRAWVGHKRSGKPYFQ